MVEACGLFSWKSEVVLQATSGSVTVHLRTLGGDQDEMRTDAALAASMKARAELEDKNSALYQNHIAPLLSLNRDGLVEIVTSLQRGLFIREARWRVEPYGDPDAPEEILSGTDVIRKPELEDILKWKEWQDSLRGELEERRDKWVAEKMEVLEGELKGLGKSTLQDRTVSLHKAAIIERAYNREWDFQTVFLGSFKDKKCAKSFFRAIQEVRDLPRPQFMQIAAAYLELDTFSRDPEQLKNLS